jgi:hypothetical protein
MLFLTISIYLSFIICILVDTIKDAGLDLISAAFVASHDMDVEVCHISFVLI